MISRLLADRHPAMCQEPDQLVGGCQVALEWIDGWDKPARHQGGIVFPA